jgi:hypothetical protein
MPDQSGHANPRDFRFQSPDQSFSHQLGGADVATSTPYPQQSHDRYDAERSNAPNAPSSSNQAPMQDGSIRYSDFGATQSSLPPQASQAHFPGYSFSPGGPLVWDWNSSLEFPDFTNHYEPQGELVQELQNNQGGSTNDFVIPLPVVNADTIYQSPQPVQSAPLVAPLINAQNPLSPPPKPPQRPSSLQTGMKRKAESEPNSAVSNPTSFSAELQQNPAKRVNKSRSSSSASITSPAVTATAEPRRLSMTQISIPLAGSESAPPAVSSANNEGSRRKEPSKGTGPQGRMIDVSKPRRSVPETPAGQDTLPAGKVFPIQIGSELFRLSGASISSDGKQLPTNIPHL